MCISCIASVLLITPGRHYEKLRQLDYVARLRCLSSDFYNVMVILIMLLKADGVKFND